MLNHHPTGHTALTRNVRRLLAENLEGAVVEVRFMGEQVKTTSGRDGMFEANFTAPAERPFEPGLHVAEAKVPGSNVSTATVDIIGQKAPYFVVSDFDDTLAVTEVLSTRGFLSNSLFKDGSSQAVVKGMPELFACLKESHEQRPVFALVSGSPQQYAPRVGDFLRTHAFPSFGLYLRDLGLTQPSDYKPPVIRSLLKALPYPVVLIGDSGQRDPEVYSLIKDEFPGRVKAIYIHDVGRSTDAARFKDMVLFKEPLTAAQDAAARGLLSPACVSKAFGEVAP